MSYALNLSLAKKRELVAKFRLEVENNKLENLQNFLDDIFYKSHLYDNNFKQMIEALITCGENSPDFLQKLKEYSYSTICGLVWNTSFVAYRCRTCAISPCMSICPTCFKGANHETEGHDYNLFRSQAGGACDCGDPNVMKPEGFCTKHSECINNRPKPPRNMVRLTEVVAPYLVTKLIAFFREFCGSNGEMSINDDVPLCNSYIEFISSYIDVASPLRDIIANALIDPKVYDDFVKDVHNKGGKNENNDKKSYANIIGNQESHYRSLFVEHYESYVSACNKLGTDPRGVQMCQLIDFHDRNTLRFFQHSTAIDELMMWCFACELPQFLVTFFLSFLTLQEYKDTFCRAFVKHYACLPRVLMRSQDPDTVSYRLVHISVQLFSNELLAKQMVVGESKLLHLIVNSLNLLLLPILIPQARDGTNLHVTVDCSHKIMQSHCYWPIVSDFITLLSHNSVAKYFLAENHLLILWTHILYCFQGMNVNKRETAEHLEFEPRTYYVAFSSELETCSATLSALLSHLQHEAKIDDQNMDKLTTNVQFKDFKGLLNNVLLSIQDWFEVIDGGEEPHPDQVSFHLPLHRYLALMLSVGVRHYNMSGYDVIDVLADTHPSLSLQTYLRNMVKHPLRIQVAIHEIACGMWVRNGMQIKCQVLTYLQSNFNHCMAYPDIFILQLCACLIPAEEFVNIILDGFGVRTLLPLWKKGGSSQQYRLLEGSLQLIATLVTFKNLTNQQEHEALKNEMVACLCKGKPTHSQLLELVPDKSAYSNANRQNGKFKTVLDEIAVYKPPDFEAGGEISQGHYEPKGFVWEKLYDPLQLMFTDMTRKDFQTSMDRYKEYWKWKLAKTRGNKVSTLDLWPPFRIPTANLEKAEQNSTKLFDMLPNLLHTESLFIVLINVLYGYIRNPSHFPETLLQMAVYLLRLALQLPAISRNSFAQLNQEKLVLKMGVSSEYSKAKRKESLIDPERDDLPPKLAELNDPYSSKPASAVLDGRQLAHQDYAKELETGTSAYVDSQTFMEKWLEQSESKPSLQSAIHFNPPLYTASSIRTSLFNKFASIAMQPSSRSSPIQPVKEITVVSCLKQILQGTSSISQPFDLDHVGGASHYISQVLNDLSPTSGSAAGPGNYFSATSLAGKTGNNDSVSGSQSWTHEAKTQPKTNDKKRLARDRQKKIMDAFAAKQKKFIKYIASDMSSVTPTFMGKEMKDFEDAFSSPITSQGAVRTENFDQTPITAMDFENSVKDSINPTTDSGASDPLPKDESADNMKVHCAICGMSQRLNRELSNEVEASVEDVNYQPIGLVTFINGSNVNGRRWNSYLQIPEICKPETFKVPLALTFPPQNATSDLGTSHVFTDSQGLSEEKMLPIRATTNEMVASLHKFSSSLLNSPRNVDYELPFSLAEMGNFKKTLTTMLISLRISSQKWYYATQSYGWDKYPHVTTCGHYLHVSCHQSYLQTLQTQNNTFNSSIVSNLGEYQCPVCRQLANSLLPVPNATGPDSSKTDSTPQYPDLQDQLLSMTDAPIEIPLNLDVDLRKYSHLAPSLEERAQAIFLDRLMEYFFPPPPPLSEIPSQDAFYAPDDPLPPLFPSFHSFAQLSATLRMNVMAEITANLLSTADLCPLKKTLNTDLTQSSESNSEASVTVETSSVNPVPIGDGQRFSLPDSKLHFLNSLTCALTARKLRLGDNGLVEIMTSLVKLFQSITGLTEMENCHNDLDLAEIVSINLADPCAVLTNIVLAFSDEEGSISRKFFTRTLRFIFRFHLYQLTHDFYVCYKNDPEIRLYQESVIVALRWMTDLLHQNTLPYLKDFSMFSCLTASCLLHVHGKYAGFHQANLAHPTNKDSSSRGQLIATSLLKEIARKMLSFLRFSCVCKDFLFIKDANACVAPWKPQLPKPNVDEDHSFAAVMNDFMERTSLFGADGESMDFSAFYDPRVNPICDKLITRLIPIETENCNKNVPHDLVLDEIMDFDESSDSEDALYPKTFQTLATVKPLCNNDLANSLSSAVALIVVSDDCWKLKPGFMRLPPCYDQLFSLYYASKCKECGLIPVDPAICLRCGNIICLKDACCSKNTIYEAVGHAMKCGAGTAVYQIINSSLILIIYGYRACIWGSLYLDKFGEEDKDLKRGKPLFLCQPRLQYLETLYVTDSFSKHIKRWTWHMNIL